MKRCECSVCSPLPNTGILITSEGEVVVDERPLHNDPELFPFNDYTIKIQNRSEHTHALLLGFFRLVRVLQVIERGARWTAQDLEAELDK